VRSCCCIAEEVWCRDKCICHACVSSLLQSLLDTIERERRGETINRSLVSSLVRMFTQMKLYTSDFEGKFLKVRTGVACGAIGARAMYAPSPHACAAPRQSTATFYRQEGLRHVVESDVRRACVRQSGCTCPMQSIVSCVCVRVCVRACVCCAGGTTCLRAAYIAVCGTRPPGVFVFATCPAAIERRGAFTIMRCSPFDVWCEGCRGVFVLRCVVVVFLPSSLVCHLTVRLFCSAE